MRKLMVLMALFALLGAACGGGEDEGELTTARGTEAPQATSETTDDGSEETAEPADDAQTDDGQTDATDDGADDGGEPASTQPPAPAGGDTDGVSPPSDGSYVYGLEGSSTDPFNPAGPPRSYSEDAEAYVDISHDGDVYTAESTTTESPGVSTTKTKWEADRVLLLSLKTETGQGDFGCVFDPPIVATKLPPQPQTYETQNWECKDGEGSGSTDITMAGPEDVTDANGKTWSTWKVETHTNFDFGQVSGVQDDTRWISPELGTDIRSDGTAEGSFELGPGTSQDFSSEQRTVLKSYPGG